MIDLMMHHSQALDRPACGSTEFYGLTRLSHHVTCPRCKRGRLHHLLSKYKTRGRLVALELSELVDLLIEDRATRIREGRQ